MALLLACATAPLGRRCLQRKEVRKVHWLARLLPILKSQKDVRVAVSTVYTEFTEHANTADLSCVHHGHMVSIYVLSMVQCNHGHMVSIYVYPLPNRGTAAFMILFTRKLT